MCSGAGLQASLQQRKGVLESLGSGPGSEREDPAKKKARSWCTMLPHSAAPALLLLCAGALIGVTKACPIREMVVVLADPPYYSWEQCTCDACAPAVHVMTSPLGLVRWRSCRVFGVNTYLPGVPAPRPAVPQWTQGSLLVLCS